MKSISDDQHFFDRLAQAVSWCRLRASLVDPARSLRSPELFPNLLAPERASVVMDVLRSRASALRKVDVRPVQSDRDLLGGRLLVYYPDGNLVDGAAELASRGYFDLNNIPPWDTWVGLFRSDSTDPSESEYLISYVPPKLVSLAGAGIEANPEVCIQWLTQTDMPLGNMLRSDGWLL
jgi:hypothetical protein